MYLKDKKSIIITAILSFLLLESIAVMAVVYIKEHDTKNFLDVISPDFKRHIHIANIHLTDISKIFYDISVDKPEIEVLMYKASQANSTQEAVQLREKLLRLLHPTYETMKQYHVRQLHFHLPGTISFLRFHRPQKFGDSLVGIRKTLEYVNKYKTPISVFKEGRIFNVFPIYYRDKFVGTVEISFSFSAIQELLSKIDKTNYLFMIKDEKQRYEKSEFYGYDYDKVTLLDSMEISLKEIHSINKTICDDVRTQIERGENFSLYYKNRAVLQNHSIVVSFTPVKNIDKKVVAYIIHYEYGDFIDIISKNTQILLIILTFLAILLSSIFTIIFIYERKKHIKMHDFAVHDALTGIYNRHGVNELIHQKIEEFKRDAKPLSVIFFDIDFFKHVNDTGDEVLRSISILISKEIRSSDIFARWGGEEFIIFLPNTELIDAVELAEKLRVNIENYTFEDVKKVTCSFGVTTLKGEESKEDFLRRVDEILYEAKESGRNCIKSDYKT